ncbi:phosphoribosyltransferase family protein [Budvicia diplopodorum]|uniref:phosphoribosyltransferase family protein n=1 Tax=Budvicia diplopodorum TaxID=1119056 RepID=UPI001357FC9E|nr:phosphoribosyltransferase family protein [Budvicia diplopodorum]
MPIVDSLCWFCLQPLAIPQQSICSVCLRHLPPLPVCCPRCGLPAPENSELCNQCKHHPPRWQRLIAVSDYLGPVKYLITRLKFYGEDKYAPLLSRLLLLAWLNARRTQLLSKPDIIITVPLHHTRRWRRGFNQTEPIGRRLAKWIGCPFNPTLVVRHRSTPPQQSLSAYDRQYNLQHAFSCNQRLDGLHIALLDDIVTTGNTVAEISNLLLKNGAASVQIWCLCRTLKNDQQ